MVATDKTHFPLPSGPACATCQRVKSASSKTPFIDCDACALVQYCTKKCKKELDKDHKKVCEKYVNAVLAYDDVKNTIGDTKDKPLKYYNTALKLVELAFKMGEDTGIRLPYEKTMALIEAIQEDPPQNFDAWANAPRLLTILAATYANLSMFDKFQEAIKELKRIKKKKAPLTDLVFHALKLEVNIDDKKCKEFTAAQDRVEQLVSGFSNGNVGAPGSPYMEKVEHESDKGFFAFRAFFQRIALQGNQPSVTAYVKGEKIEEYVKARPKKGLKSKAGKNTESVDDEDKTVASKDDENEEQPMEVEGNVKKIAKGKKAKKEPKKKSSKANLAPMEEELAEAESAVTKDEIEGKKETKKVPKKKASKKQDKKKAEAEQVEDDAEEANSAPMEEELTEVETGVNKDEIDEKKETKKVAKKKAPKKQDKKKAATEQVEDEGEEETSVEKEANSAQMEEEVAEADPEVTKEETDVKKETKKVAKRKTSKKQDKKKAEPEQAENEVEGETLVEKEVQAEAKPKTKVRKQSKKKNPEELSEVNSEGLEEVDEMPQNSDEPETDEKASDATFDIPAPPKVEADSTTDENSLMSEDNENEEQPMEVEEEDNVPKVAKGKKAKKEPKKKVSKKQDKKNAEIEQVEDEAEEETLVEKEVQKEAKPKAKVRKQSKKKNLEEQSEVNSEGLEEVEKEAKNKPKKQASKRSHEDSLEEVKESGEVTEENEAVTEEEEEAPPKKAVKKKAEKAKGKANKKPTKADEKKAEREAKKKAKQEAKEAAADTEV